MSTGGYQATLDDLGWNEDELTPAERDVWNSVECGEYGPREYARMTDRAPGTVGNLLSRARAKMGASW